MSVAKMMTWINSHFRRSRQELNEQEQAQIQKRLRELLEQVPGASAPPSKQSETTP